MATVGTAQPFILGGIASLTAECGTFPIDTTKIRLQVQGQVFDSVHKNTRYRGMAHAIFRISQEEGFKALYKGIAPALLRQASYGTLKMGLYQRLKRLLSPYHGKDGSLLTNVVAGVLSGAIASSIANPTDVLKVRMQATNKTTPTPVWSAFRMLYQEEGIRGMYRGVGPTAQRAAVVAGVILPVYDLTKMWIMNYQLMGDHIGTHICASFVASFLSAVASNPIDVIKTRMMNQKLVMNGNTLTHCEHLYKNSLECLLTTLKYEGPAALYKGFVPYYLRMGPWNIIFFVTYEGLTRTLDH